MPRTPTNHWNALLRLVGVRELNRVLVTPLALDSQPNTASDSLTLVGGGRVWPWQNPWSNLQRLLEGLDEQDRGTVHWFSPPDQCIPIDHPRLQKHPWTSRADYRTVLRGLQMDWIQSRFSRKTSPLHSVIWRLGCGLSILANENILTRSEPKLCRQIDFNDLDSLQMALHQYPKQHSNVFNKHTNPHRLSPT